MTPYQTPHTSQTPRYNQASSGGHSAPHMNGPFLHPGAPISSSHHHRSNSATAGYHSSSSQGSTTSHASPHHANRHYSSSSPHAPSPHARGYSSSQAAENLDWQKAAEAWARGSSRSNSTPRDGGRGTPKGYISFDIFFEFFFNLMFL